MAAQPVLSEAEILFNDTVGRLFTRYRVVLSLRTVSQAGVATAESTITRQNIRFVSDMVTGNEFDNVFINKPAFFEHMPPAEMVQRMTAKTIEDAQLSVDVASIILMHSVLDGAASSFCRVTALLSPADWESRVDERKMKISEARNQTYQQILKIKLDQYFDQLDKESLLEKADLLWAICRPPAGWSSSGAYHYDRARLERLDRLRHDFVHGGGQLQPVPRLDEELEYLMGTGLLFVSLVNQRYGIRLTPVYMFGKMV